MTYNLLHIIRQNLGFRQLKHSPHEIGREAEYYNGKAEWVIGNDGGAGVKSEELDELRREARSTVYKTDIPFFNRLFNVGSAARTVSAAKNVLEKINSVEEVRYGRLGGTPQKRHIANEPSIPWFYPEQEVLNYFRDVGRWLETSGTQHGYSQEKLLRLARQAEIDSRHFPNIKKELLQIKEQALTAQR